MKTDLSCVTTEELAEELRNRSEKGMVLMCTGIPDSRAKPGIVAGYILLHGKSEMQFAMVSELSRMVLTGEIEGGSVVDVFPSDS